MHCFCTSCIYNPNWRDWPFFIPQKVFFYVDYLKICFPVQHLTYWYGKSVEIWPLNFCEKMCVSVSRLARQRLAGEMGRSTPEIPLISHFYHHTQTQNVSFLYDGSFLGILLIDLNDKNSILRWPYYLLTQQKPLWLICFPRLPYPPSAPGPTV